MPYVTCPACRLTSYAAGRITQDRCPRCDTALEGGERAEDPARRWNLTALRRTALSKEVEHGAR